jgi:phytoene/squalene synthetase
MAAPVEARRVLFPLYAFNVEVARAPWVASEPMIGEMRLQWWRDVLEEIGKGGPVRRHEVATPLAEVLDAGGAEALDKLVAARRWDLYSDAFEDAGHFAKYLEATGGGLMWVAARLLGAGEAARGDVVSLGRAAGLARFLQAVPDLEARGRIPLVDGRPEAVAALARQTLDEMPKRASLRQVLPGRARFAAIEAWQARPVLEQATRSPERVAEGRLGLSEFRKRITLLLASR